MFIFYFLGVGLPCRSIFCQFWLCEEVQCVYLRRHLGSPDTSLFLKIFYLLFFFRERGREGEKDREKHQYVVAFRGLPTGDLADNPSMCLDWESNLRAFASNSSTQSTDPQQPGQETSLYSFTLQIEFLAMTGNSSGSLPPPDFKTPLFSGCPLSH